jgi:hypothetical protein
MTVIRTEKRQRSGLGKVIKWTFIGYNVFCAVWLATGLSAVTSIKTHSIAEQVGAGIGASIGFAAVVATWVAGSILLGILVLLTRGDKVIVEERSQSEGGSFASQGPSDFSRADERIAEMLAQKTRPSGGAAPATQGFGKRGA